MTARYEPDPRDVKPHEHLAEFVERWRDDPAGAIACASTSNISIERAQELIDGTGKPWSLVEAADIGFMMGPSAAFWQRLVKMSRGEK